MRRRRLLAPARGGVVARPRRRAARDRHRQRARCGSRAAQDERTEEGGAGGRPTATRWDAMDEPLRRMSARRRRRPRGSAPADEGTRGLSSAARDAGRAGRRRRRGGGNGVERRWGLDSLHDSDDSQDEGGAKGGGLEPTTPTTERSGRAVSAPERGGAGAAVARAPEGRCARRSAGARGRRPCANQRVFPRRSAGARGRPPRAHQRVVRSCGSPVTLRRKRSSSCTTCATSPCGRPACTGAPPRTPRRPGTGDSR